MKKEMTYIDQVHSFGRKWNIFVMIMLLAYPIATGIIFKTGPDWHGFALGLVATAPMYWAVGIVETITYVPMLGAGGSYLSLSCRWRSTLLSRRTLRQARRRAR